MKERIKHLILFIILAGIDQFTKYLVRLRLMNQDPFVILPGILNLQYHENTGAVWGILSGKTLYLSIFTLVILVLIVYLYLHIPQTKKLKALRVLSIFILAGAVGNLIDRVFLGHVVDFIYFEIIDFPLFNVADSYLTVSCALLLILAIFYYKDDDLAFLDAMLRKKKAAGASDATDGVDASITGNTSASDNIIDSGKTFDTEDAQGTENEEEKILFDRSREEAQEDNGSEKNI